MNTTAAKPGFWKKLTNPSGFTLVEVLVALGIGSIVAWAILDLQVSQTKTAAVQAEVVAMQQALRGSMTLLTRELKKAGYKGDKNAAAGIVNVTTTSIYYTSDSDINGNSNGALTEAGEHAAFCFAANTLRFVEGNSAIVNPCNNANPVVMADLQNVEFRYLKNDGTLTAIPAEIRMVQVTLLGRTRNADPKYKNTTVYDTPSGAKWGPYNDGFRRQLMTSTVKLWNM